MTGPGALESTVRTTMWLCAAWIGLVAARAPAEPIELRVSGGSADQAVYVRLFRELLADELAAENLRPVFQPIEGDFSAYIQNALSAGTAPDLFYVDVYWANPILRSGKILPLSGDLAATADLLVPTLVDAFRYRDTLYGLPKDFNSMVLFFNKYIFIDAGVPPPAIDDDWHAFKAKLIAVREALGDDVYGTCLKPEYIKLAPFLLSTGWTPFDEDGRTVLDERFTRAFRFYVSLLHDGAGVLDQDIGQNTSMGCLITDRIAAVAEGGWSLNFFRDQAPFLEYEVVPMPRDPVTGSRGNIIFTVAWAIAADSPRQAAARRLMRLLVSPEVQNWILEEGMAIPSRSSLADSPYFDTDSKEARANKWIFEGSRDGNVMTYSFGEFGGRWVDVVESALGAALLGEKTVEAAIADAQLEYDRLTSHHGR